MNNETLTHYLAQIGQHPLLTVEEEKTATVGELIQSNLKLVVHIAKSYSRNVEELLDYIQDGNVGLIMAANRYDHTRGIFSVCAGFYIRKMIREARTRMIRTVRLPIPVSNAFTKIKHLHKIGLSDASIASELDLPIEGVKAALQQRTEELFDCEAEVNPADTCHTYLALRTLPKKERYALVGIMEGYTLAELAAKKGVTTQAISYQNQNGLKRLSL